jgi:broad specificity phosphatase PhoE
MNRSTHILLIRHGQTDANANGQLQGHQPTPLNMTGLRQANFLAARLAGHAPPVEVVISSDLTRASETAAPLAAACGLQLILDPAWRERGFGLLEGKPVGDVGMWKAASGEFDPPGAEPWADVRKRIHDALVSIPRTYASNQLIAVVTHGGPIRTVLRLLAEGELPTARGHQPIDVQVIPNASILHLIARHYSDGLRWKVESVNDVSHLDE